MFIIYACIYMYNLSERIIINDNYMFAIVGEVLLLVDAMGMLDPG